MTLNCNLNYKGERYSPTLQIKKMKGADSLYRVYIQDYRVIYLIESQMVRLTIIKIGHRKGVYEYLWKAVAKGSRLE